MQSLSEHMNESLLTEARCVCDQIPEYDSEADNRTEVATSIDSYLDKLEAVTPKELKKVKDWRNFEMDVLEDYAKVCHQVAAWCRGVAALAEDDADEAEMFKNYIESISDGQDWPGYENTAENLEDESLQTVQDGEDYYDYIEDMCNHWNELSKIVNRMPWT